MKWGMFDTHLSMWIGDDDGPHMVGAGDTRKCLQHDNTLVLTDAMAEHEARYLAVQYDNKNHHARGRTVARHIPSELIAAFAGRRVIGIHQ